MVLDRHSHDVSDFVCLSLQAEGSDVIVLKAMGRAINKAVTIAEILKRKMPLHQVNTLHSKEMIDVYEPIEEGLDVVTSRRYVSCMKITLSMTLQELKASTIVDGFDESEDILMHAGYQPPIVISSSGEEIVAHGATK